MLTAFPVVMPVALIASSPVGVVAALAVRASKVPFPVMIPVSEMDARVEVSIALPVTWKRVPPPTVELAIFPAAFMLSKPVVAFMVSEPVGPVICNAPPVVRVVAPVDIFSA